MDGYGEKFILIQCALFAGLSSIVDIDSADSSRLINMSYAFARLHTTAGTRTGNEPCAKIVFRNACSAIWSQLYMRVTYRTPAQRYRSKMFRATVQIALSVSSICPDIWTRRNLVGSSFKIYVSPSVMRVCVCELVCVQAQEK